MASRRPSLWMGNLDPYMDEDFIKRAFATMGELVQDVRVISGRSPGYCFVVLPDRAAIDRCIARLNGAVIPGSDPPQKFKLERSMAYWTKDGTSSGNLDIGTFHIQHARRPPLLGSGPHVQNAPVIPAAPVVPDASDIQTSQYLHYYQHYLNYFSQWRYNQPYGYNNSSEYWTPGSSSTLPVSSATSAVPSMTHSTSEINTAEMRNAATARYAATVLNGASLRKTAAAENCASLESTATATSSTATSTALTSSSTLGEASSVEVTLQNTTSVPEKKEEYICVEELFEDPDPPLDIDALNAEYMGRSEEMYDVLMNCHWQPLDTAISGIPAVIELR